MKKNIIMLLASALFNQFLFAQNLVPNGSFEDTVACPFGPGNIDKAVGWSSCRPSPDYFNSCANNYVGVPSNSFGFQEARSGNAYTGFYTYLGGGNVREIIGCQLSQQMIIGQKYFVSVFVSMALKDNAFGHHLNSATNKIGVRFSTISYSNTNLVPIDNYAQVYTDSVILDTINWVPISGSFIADSAYSYVSIGNFFTDSATTHISLDTLPQFYPNAYYFADDVYVSTDSLIGVAEIKNNQPIDIYPNPTKNILHVRGTSQSGIDVDIYSSLGQHITQYHIRQNETIIDLADLAEGVYLIIVKQKEIIIPKIIIKY